MSETVTEYFDIEIVYALPAHQVLKQWRVPVGSTIKQAIHDSGILDEFPEIDLNKNKFGIFSQFATPETILQPHDRIEIYRPLLIDPKEARRIRVSKKQSGK